MLSNLLPENKPYRKPNEVPLYIHKHPNHPPSILRQIPASINKRISALSSDKQVFDDAVQTYPGFVTPWKSWKTLDFNSSPEKPLKTIEC